MAKNSIIKNIFSVVNLTIMAVVLFFLIYFVGNQFTESLAVPLLLFSIASIFWISGILYGGITNKKWMYMHIFWADIILFFLVFVIKLISSISVILAQEASFSSILDFELMVRLLVATILISLAVKMRHLSKCSSSDLI